MKFRRSLFFAISMIVISSCGSRLPDEYPMKKRFWDASDYKTAIRYIKYQLDDDEGYPRLSDPVTAPVFRKLVDKQNVAIILEDEQLGLTYRDDVGSDFFHITQDLNKMYQLIDIQDKFIYPEELVLVLDFALYTQVLYLEVGNEEIIKDAIDPDDAATQRLISRNRQIIVDNYNNYLEILAKEDAFNDKARREYAEVIKTHLQTLLDMYPGSDYSKTKNTANLILKKASTPEVRNATTILIQKIESN
ncbi:MAG: hypothetical protein ABFS32_15260 [Bacteroidota bacterium]